MLASEWAHIKATPSSSVGTTQTGDRPHLTQHMIPEEIRPYYTHLLTGDGIPRICSL